MSYTTSSRRSSVSRKIAGAVLVLVLGGGVVAGIAAPYTNAQTKTCTVESKDRTRDKDGKSDMRVYTEDCGVLRVQDMVFAGEWNSADTFASLKEGQTYEVTTTGYRVGVFSSFPVIREVAPVQG